MRDESLSTPSDANIWTLNGWPFWPSQCFSMAFWFTNSTTLLNNAMLSKVITQDVMHSKFTWPRVLKASANINKLLRLLYTRCSPHSSNTINLSKIFHKDPPSYWGFQQQNLCAFNQNPDGYRLKFQQLFECTHDGREDQINCPIIKP